MKKLLLVLLVPVLVLGITMGCGETIDVDIQTDHLIQNTWVHEGGAYILIISSQMMTVKYGDVSTPYKTEFAYSSTRTPTSTKIDGDITMFRYEDKTELAVFTVAYDGSGEEATLTIKNLEPSEDEWYKADAFPKEGKYTIGAEGTPGGGEKPPVTKDWWDDAVGMDGIQVYDSGSNPPLTFEDGILTMDQTKGSGGFRVPIPAGVTATDKFVIKFLVKQEAPMAGEIKFTLKCSGGWTDIAGTPPGSVYATFTPGEDGFEYEVDLNLFTTAGEPAASLTAGFVGFQRNGDFDCLIKVISVTKK